MLRLNKEDFSIEVVESLSFEYHVLPILDVIREEVQGDIEEHETDNDTESEKTFLQHELTDQDKLDILELIVEDYEWNYCEHSIFDDAIIRSNICAWIEKKFEFDWE